MKICRQEKLWKNWKLGKQIEGGKDISKKGEVSLQGLKPGNKDVEHLTLK